MDPAWRFTRGRRNRHPHRQNAGSENDERDGDDPKADPEWMKLASAD
jgi:hypothetical protein